MGRCGIPANFINDWRRIGVHPAAMSNPSSPSPLGRLLSIGLILVLIASGLFVLMRKKQADHTASPGGPPGSAGESAPVLSETLTAVPALGPPGVAPLK